MSGVWPYQDVKMKNSSKRIIFEYLNRLVESKKLLLSDVHSSILSLAKGDKVWKLLYKLSEHCVTICINQYNATEAIPNSFQHIGDVDIQLLPNLITYKLIVEVINNNSNDAVLIDEIIQTEYNLLITECKKAAKRHNEVSEYSNELDKRFKAANRSIDTRYTCVTFNLLDYSLARSLTYLFTT